MFARAIFSFHPAYPHAPTRFPSKSFLSPTYENSPRNFFVSPTYAKTGGCTPPKMSARRHFLSLFSQPPISALPSIFRTLPQKPGGVPLRSNQSHSFPMRSEPYLFALGCRLSTVDCWPPFLSLHSPAIHKAVTGASPIFLPGLSQWRAVRGPTHTPCLPSTRGLRYTSTDAIRSARSAHEARTDY